MGGKTRAGGTGCCEGDPGEAVCPEPACCLRAWYRPSDRLAIAWMAMAGVALCWAVTPWHSALPEEPRWWLIALLHAAGLAALVVLLPLSARSHNRAVVFARRWYPGLYIPLLFKELACLVPAVNPHAVDTLLLAFDRMLFGMAPTLLLEKVQSPLLTELSFLAYASFYFLPLAVAVRHVRKGRTRQLDAWIFLIQLNFYIAFVLYFLMPCVGPRVTLRGLYAEPLRGLFAADWIASAIHGMEGIQHDCFPSSHTQIAVLVAGYSYLRRKVTLAVTGPLAAAIIFSTVYCRFHYVGDVLAGGAIALVTLALWERLYRAAGGGAAIGISKKR